MFALFEDELTIILWTAGFAAFLLWQATKSSAATLSRNDNQLKMCLLCTCESSVKPIKGHNKANWFWRIKKTLRIIRVTTWVTRIFYSKSVLGFGINQHSQSLLFISCFATAMFTLRNCHVYASQVPCLYFMNAMFTLHECHVYNIQMMMFWLCKHALQRTKKC